MLVPSLAQGKGMCQLITPLCSAHRDLHAVLTDKGGGGDHVSGSP